MQVGLTLAQRRDESSDVGPNNIASQHTTEPLGCVQLGGVLLGCVQFG